MFYWWLHGVSYVVGFDFLAQNLGKVLGTYECHHDSVHVDGVLVLFAGGGDT